MRHSGSNIRPVMTLLEARVPPDRWASLEASYASATEQLPSQMLETFLVQSATDAELWRVVSVWRNRDAMEEYRRSVATPGGVLIFRAAGVEPTLALFEVIATVHAGAS